MNIVSEYADFSNVGLGKVVTEVESDVKSLLEGYDSLELPLQLKFQKFIDDIGGINGTIWSGVELLLVPYFANTIDEAYFNVKTGSVKNPGSSSHKAACSPIRGIGATYDTSSYGNCLNFTLSLSAGSKYFGVCQNIKQYPSNTQVNIISGGDLGAISNGNTGADYFNTISGLIIDETPYYPKLVQRIPIGGKHAALKGIANDVNVNRNSIVYLLDEAQTDVSSLPSGTYTSEDLTPIGSISSYKFNTTGVDYTKNIYTMFIIGENLSKNELVTLNTAMYNFCKYA